MSSHRRFAAAELKRTSPSPRVVSSESDDDVPEVSYPSQPKVSSPRCELLLQTELAYIDILVNLKMRLDSVKRLTQIQNIS